MITIHKHVAVLLRGFKWWTMRKDQQWTKCKVFFAYIGNMNFIHIECISEEWLNKTATKVPLGGVVTRIEKRKRLVECCAGLPPVKKREDAQRKKCHQKITRSPLEKCGQGEARLKGKTDEGCSLF